MKGNKIAKKEKPAEPKKKTAVHKMLIEGKLIFTYVAKDDFRPG